MGIRVEVSNIKLSTLKKINDWKILLKSLSSQKIILINVWKINMTYTVPPYNIKLWTMNFIFFFIKSKILKTWSLIPILLLRPEISYPSTPALPSVNHYAYGCSLPGLAGFTITGLGISYEIPCLVTHLSSRCFDEI